MSVTLGPLLLLLTNCKHTYVNLPNGNFICIEFIGSVQLFPNLTLYNALLIPTFNYHLISVNSLLVQNSFSLKSTYDTCLFHNLSQTEMIGMAKRVGILYVLHLVGDKSLHSTSCNKVLLDQSELWQNRLGHPSFTNVLK